MSFQEAMSALEKAGSAQTRKTYGRHGAPEPMFGVSFATLKTLYKRIKIDQELAEALWSTGNFDARNLAIKIADPASISSRELDWWAATPTRACARAMSLILRPRVRWGGRRPTSGLRLRTSRRCRLGGILLERWR
ncbi:MAG: DNA alkylation repair protein [Planctomycetes bacterium]|nr:DNA alkylation repair protein [Planctomycetota bacterium]